MWPKYLQFSDALEIPKEDQPVLPHEVVPRSYAGLLAWAYIRQNRRVKDHTRGLMLLYKDPPVYPNSPAELMCPVGVRVQGFIERCNLKTLGNWTR
jgi:hypothetical protein